MQTVLTLVAATGQDIPDAALARVRAALPADPAETRTPGALHLRFEAADAAAVRGDVADALADAPVDFCVQPAELQGGRKLLLADMDSTMITVECIDELADFAGVRDAVHAITERAMKGEIDFEGALTERVALMKGLKESALQQCFDERVRLSPGARELVQGCRAAGIHCALVSGGFTFFTHRVAELCGFDENRANTLIFEDGVLTGEVTQPILGRQAKIDALNEICGRLGIGPERAVAMGDGANDLGMIELAGLGVAWRAKPITAEAADARIDHGDLTTLLRFMGL